MKKNPNTMEQFLFDTFDSYLSLGGTVTKSENQITIKANFGCIKVSKYESNFYKEVAEKRKNGSIVYCLDGEPEPFRYRISGTFSNRGAMGTVITKKQYDSLINKLPQ